MALSRSILNTFIETLLKGVKMRYCHVCDVWWRVLIDVLIGVSRHMNWISEKNQTYQSEVCGGRRGNQFNRNRAVVLNVDLHVGPELAV